MIFFKAIAFALLIVGAIMVYSADLMVDKYSLAKRINVNFENNMSEDELVTHKRNKAIVNFKMLGMLVMLPGMILILVFFK